VLEKNRPAGFKRPLYGVMGDWVMYRVAALRLTPRPGPLDPLPICSSSCRAR
jgi:hypothetical protein